MATTTGFKVQCPSCEAMVTIKNASLVGKKIDCPKCKYRFVVEAPADLDEETAAVVKGKKQAGGTAVAKKSAGQAVGRRRRGRRGPPGKKKKKSNLILILGVGIVFLTAGLIAAAYFGGLFGGDEEKPQANSTPNPVPRAVRRAHAPAGTQAAGTQQADPGTGPAVAESGGGLPRSATTNLLPNDSQWVLDVDIPQALATPAGSRVFDGQSRRRPWSSSTSGAGRADQPDRRIRRRGRVVDVHRHPDEDGVQPGRPEGRPWSWATPSGTIKKREYFLAKDNPVFQAVGNFFKTKLVDFGFKVDPPPGERQLTVCFLDGKTLAVADRQVMETFLNADAQPEYLSKLTGPAAPSGPAGQPRVWRVEGPGGAAGPGGPMMPGAGGPAPRVPARRLPARGR